MKYKYLLFISIIISLCIWGYFSFQRKIIFIEHPTLEINSVFHYQEYIYKIKKGSIKEVTYNAKDLNIHALMIIHINTILQLIRKISIPIKRDHIQSYTKLLTYQIIKRFLNVK